MLKLFNILLNLHDGEGGGADAGADTGAGEASSTTEAVDAGQQGEVSEVDTAKEFSDLIRGKYKNEYKAATQELINKRFAKSKETEAKLAEQNGILDLLHQRYGTRSNEALLEALENDEDYLEKRAYELGMTREQAADYDRMQRKLSMYERNAAQNEQQAKIDERIAKWREEEAEVKTIYPSFSLDEESQNDIFANLIAENIPMKTAFEVTHHDEIMQAGVAYAARETEKKVTENIRARGNRPTEVGASNKASFTQTTDVSKLSLEQIRDYEKRAARGENITFR